MQKVGASVVVLDAASVIKFLLKVGLRVGISFLRQNKPPVGQMGRGKGSTHSVFGPQSPTNQKSKICATAMFGIKHVTNAKA